MDAWRIKMCLQSGLLSESTYALDMLNILLFDDSSVGYFCLNQWPGLLDLLLEHFKKCLSDVFDEPYPKEEKEEKDVVEVDLGRVAQPIDPNMKTILLNNTTNYTLMSRKGHPVKLVDRPDDIFVHDNVKEWDTRGDPNRGNILAEIPTDPWHTTTDHILPPFQGEFGQIPFHMRLSDKDDLSKVSEEAIESKAKSPPPDETPPPDEAPPPAKNSEKRRRTKTLSDVISRIKKDSSEANKALESTDDKVKTEVVSEITDREDKPSIDLKVSVNGECGDKNQPNSAVKSDSTIGKSDNELITDSGDSSPAIHDAVGGSKRRRISDFEDEAYTRDEASLLLLTESQDNIGKRCVCISNILRSLTFIPGNETEFAKSSSFLALIGKLLLLYHEHPLRTQKTRNYDREVSS